MQKFALCVNNPEDIQKAVAGELETIGFTMVDRAICELPENEYHQVIPYVVFYSVHPEEGRVEILQYLRASKTPEGEDVTEKRLAGSSSVGFGGHIDNEDDIVFTSKSVNKKGEVTYELTVDQVVETVSKTGYREVDEELGYNVREVVPYEILPESLLFFKGKEQNDVNKVHLAFGCLVGLEEDQFTLLKESAKPEPSEIEQLGILGINYGDILSSFNVNQEVAKITDELSNNNALEDWSCVMVETITLGLCQRVSLSLDWKSILEAHVSRMEFLKQEYEKEQQELLEETVTETEVTEAVVEDEKGFQA